MTRHISGMHIAAVALTSWGLLTLPSAGELFINEIFFNPPESDLTLEYIELRGPAGINLDNHYLIFLENELDELGLGDAGMVEAIFDLNGRTMGTNGFLTFRHKGSPYTVAAGTTDLINTGAGPGFGSGASSNIGASFDNGSGLLANSGFTAMLIRNDGDPDANKPTLGLDLDTDKNGLDHPDGREGWVILDSIGIHAEANHTEFGRLYGQVNFAGNDPMFPFTDTPRVEEGAEFLLVDYEIEHLARWGNSTGQTSVDWHITNVTNRPVSGFLGPADFRQAAEPHPACAGCELPSGAQVETNRETPYGVNIMGTLGAPNYLQGDYNGDGYVDAADYTVWRDMQGLEGADLVADGDNDRTVDGTDYAIWASRFGQPLSDGGVASSRSTSTAVPEPAALACGLLATLAVSHAVRRLPHLLQPRRHLPHG